MLDDVFELDAPETPTQQLMVLDSMTPDEQRKLAPVIARMFNEPLKASTEEIIARHRRRLLNLCN
jgi:hypothetical protein